MSAAPTSLRPSPQPETPVFFVWLGAAAVGFGAGFAAVYVQDTFAPVGVFPLLLGLISGLAVGGAWLARGAATKRSVLLTGLLAGVVCIATLHYGSYFAARRADERRIADAADKARMLVPEARNFVPFQTFGGYMQREWARGRGLGPVHVRGPWLGVWWAVDAALILGAAMFGARSAAKSIVRPTTRETTLDSADAGAAS